MANWLLKTEPNDYSFEDLVRDRTTPWDGVRNALALQHLRKAAKGDQCLIYHTGKERSVIGTATVTRAAYPDPNADDERMVCDDCGAEKLERWNPALGVYESTDLLDPDEPKGD